MQINGIQPEPFEFSDPRQKRIHKNLLLVGPGPAAFFRDAYRIMTTRPCEATSHLVAHLLREIESALRDVLEPLVDPDVLKHEKKANRDEKHEAEVRVILNALNIPESGPIGRAWLALAGKDNEYGLAALAHRHSLAAPRFVSDEFMVFWERIQIILDEVLKEFQLKFLAYLSMLDNLLLKSEPTEHDIQFLRGKIPNNAVTLRYFFERLQSEKWLVRLNEAGFFSNPPRAIPKDEGTVYHEYWPHTHYLKRMAPIASIEVCNVIGGIPSTGHGRVYAELMDAILGMPPKVAATLTDSVAQWLRNPDGWLVSERSGKLIEHLASGGEGQSALHIAEEVLDIMPDPRAAEKSAKSEMLGPNFSPKNRMENWHFEHILKESFPSLVDATGMAALVLLCDLLNKSFVLAGEDAEGCGSIDDHSYIWREDIEDDTNHHYDEIKNPLVSAIRDACIHLLRGSKATMNEVIDMLAAYRWMIYQRIALYLMSMQHCSDNNLVSRYLANETLFYNNTVSREYASLFKERFGDLSDSDKTIILGMIEKGPRYHMDSEDDADKWRRDWLSLIVEHLPEQWKEQYEGFVTRLGPSQEPIPPKHSSAFWIGPTSPITAADLDAMSVEEIINYINTWQPERQFMRPSPEGLGRELTAAVAANPIRFAEAATKFNAVSEPTYISSLLSGFQQAAKQKRIFKWDALIDLAQEVVRRPREIPGRAPSEDHDYDPDWGWSRKEIGGLIRDGFAIKKGGIPLRLRFKVWKILEVLTDDPDPTLEHEQVYGGSNQDPANMSINTTRGIAMHAVLRYACWIRRRIDKRKNREELIARGFDEMPEVRLLLDRHLDLSIDSALTIRAVYGWWFPQLVFLDSVWAKANAHKIFPMAEDERGYWNAAWISYMLFGNQIHYSFYDILEEQYHTAIDRTRDISGDDPDFSEADERLGKHLITLYWWERINIADLSQFFTKTHPKLRAVALAYAGYSLCKDTNIISPEKLANLQKLWEWRLEEMKEAPSADRRAELSAFGWWAISGKFPMNWTLDRFKEGLGLAGWAEPDDEVIKWLADLAQAMPMFSVQCLTIMAEGDRDSWGLYYSWQEHIRNIIASALQSSDIDAQKVATNLVNNFCSKGIIQYRDLLQNDNSSDLE